MAGLRRTKNPKVRTVFRKNCIAVLLFIISRSRPIATAQVV
jgi:hypothetical protein